MLKSAAKKHQMEINVVHLIINVSSNEAKIEIPASFISEVLDTKNGITVGTL